MYGDTWWFFWGWLKWQPGRVPHEKSSPGFGNTTMAAGLLLASITWVLLACCVLVVCALQASLEVLPQATWWKVLKAYIIYVGNWSYIYVCVCACVMFNICVCDVHPCTINFALLSLDMVVWDADYDVILLSVGFSTSWSHVSGDYFRGRHECPPYTEELVSSSWVSWAGPGRKWLPGVSFGLCWPHLIFSCTRGLIKSTISRATAEYSKIFQDDSHVTSCNYADYAYITFIALMNQHQWNIGTAFRILP